MNRRNHHHMAKRYEKEEIYNYFREIVLNFHMNMLFVLIYNCTGNHLSIMQIRILHGQNMYQAPVFLPCSNTRTIRTY